MVSARRRRCCQPDNGRGTNYVYTFNGRGLATGLTPTDDPNAFAERYGYELTGSYFVTEIGGIPVAPPDSTTRPRPRSGTRS